jgi:hypothetical protein
MSAGATAEDEEVLRFVGEALTRLTVSALARGMAMPLSFEVVGFNGGVLRGSLNDSGAKINGESNHVEISFPITLRVSDGNREREVIVHHRPANEVVPQ